MNPCIWCDRFPVRFANASNVTTAAVEAFHARGSRLAQSRTSTTLPSPAKAECRLLVLGKYGAFCHIFGGYRYSAPDYFRLRFKSPGHGFTVDQDQKALTK